MRDINDILFEKFSERDFTSLELSRLIKDVMNIIGDGGEFTLSQVNQELENLGWQKQVLDEFSFELILFYIETEHRYTVVEHTLH